MKEKDLHLAFSVSMTTRSKRFDEVDGKDYFFVTRERFEQAIKNHEMLEWAKYVNNYYGTPKTYVEKLRNAGENVLLEIESNGALQIMDYAKNTKDHRIVTILIMPPSLASLEERLRARSTESPQVCAARIKQAE
jgi:guanylate kinase